ncbi:MAG: ribosome biogenesis GTP-binding protein YihA/YsxC [Gammaproteobacteria bacterium]|nr:ribosome biogenesis GTP-binding protein YihA/YsxC [Gammaproteobacteria bacterium]
MDFKNQLANTAFYTSASSADSLPPDEGHEVAFAGRSNAGKSSAINRLCQKKSLARTSKTPGRTQLINFFSVSPLNKLADLPGYGYAKASHSKQRQWLKLLEYYFTHRQALKGTIIVMDIRHPFQDSDQKMIDWCVHHQCDVHILLNKSDKLSRNQAHKQLQIANKILSQYQDALTSIQLFSALTGNGVDEAASKIKRWFEAE